MSVLGKPVFPKEHGAWMVLLVSLTAGSFAQSPPEGAYWGGFIALTGAAIFGFMAFTPLRMLIKPVAGVNLRRMGVWFSIYGGAAGLCFAWLVFGMERYGLLWFAAPAAFLTLSYLWSSFARTQRSLPVEIMGILGLATAGPAGAFTQFDAFTAESGYLYALFVIWFTDRMLMARKTLDLMRSGVKFGSAGEKARAFAPEFMAHAVSLGLVAGVIAVSGGAAPVTAFVPFLLATARNVADTVMVEGTSDPMKVGFAEMRLGIVFCAAMIMAWRMV